MSLKDQLATDLAIFFNQDELAEPALYNGSDILVIPEIGESNVQGNTITYNGSSDRAWFWVKASDVPSPNTGDEIEYLGKSWQVLRVVETDGIIHKLECIANETALPLRW